MNNEYHEKEIIRFLATNLKSRQALHQYLRMRKFKAEDDFYYFERQDSPMPWQSISVLTIDVYSRGEKVDETEYDLAGEPREWDELRVDYLLATLPRRYIQRCVIECEALASQFDLQIEFHGELVNPAKLQLALEQFAECLTDEWAEPGSEALALLIDLNYGK